MTGHSWNFCADRCVAPKPHFNYNGGFGHQTFGIFERSLTWLSRQTRSKAASR